MKRRVVFLAALFAAALMCVNGVNGRAQEPRLTVEEGVAFAGHSRRMRSLAYSPDGKLIASGGDYIERAVHIWDVDKGACVRTLTLGAAPKPAFSGVNALVFSPDSKTLVVGTLNNLWMWDVRTGRLIRELKGHTKGVSAALFSPDGKTLVSCGGSTGDVRFWDVETGALLRTIDAHERGVWSAAMSPDGKTLITGGGNGENMLRWDAQTGAALGALGHKRAVKSIDISPDGQTIVVVGSEGNAQIWSMDGKPQAALERSNYGTESAVFSPDGMIIAGVDEGDFIMFWDAQTGALLHTFKADNTAAASVAFSPDGKTLACGIGWAVQLLHLNPPPKKPTRQAPTPAPSPPLQLRIQKGVVLKGQSRASAIAYSPDSKRLRSVHLDSALRHWTIEDEERGDSSKRAPPIMLIGHGFGSGTEKSPGVASIAFSPDGKTLASGGNFIDQTLRIWDAQTGAPLKTLTDGSSSFDTIAYSPDSKRIVSGGFSIKLWDLQTGEYVKTLGGGQGFYHRAVAYSPDGRRIASDSGKVVWLWDAERGGCVRFKPLRGHTNGLRCLAFSPDSKRLISGSYDETLRIWSAEDGAFLQTLTGHTGAVTSVAYSPDGALIASLGWSQGSPDRTIRFWEAQTGRLVGTVRGRYSGSLAFSPDGRALACIEGAKIHTWILER